MDIQARFSAAKQWLTGAKTTQTGSDSARRKYLIPLAFTAATVTVVGGTTVYSLNDTTATVVIDGEAQSVRFFGQTVDKALAEANVSVSANDVVTPALGSKVRDGAEITVTYARPLQLVVDGKETTHQVAAQTVGEALDLLNVRADEANLSVSRSLLLGREGLKVEVNTLTSLTIRADGKDTMTTTTSGTVAQALAAAGINVGADDLVTPALASEVTEASTITVVRVTREEVSRTESVPFDRTTTSSKFLAEGTKKVTAEGKNGERTITEVIIRHDGEEVRREQLRAEVTKKPVTQVTAVGTKKPVTKPTPTPTTTKPGTPKPTTKPTTKPKPTKEPTGNTVWDRLAKCESGGNWKINTGNGYYGGLQFSARSWRAVGGTGLPHQHSRETQIAMGKRLKAKQGWGAWPACSRKLGLR